MEGARVINYSRNQEPAKLSHLPRAPIHRAGSRLPRRGALRGRGSAHPGDVGPQRGCGGQARAGTQAGKCRGEGGVTSGESGGSLAMGWRKHGQRLEQGKWALQRKGLIWALWNTNIFGRGLLCVWPLLITDCANYKWNGSFPSFSARAPWLMLEFASSAPRSPSHLLPHILYHLRCQTIAIWPFK